MKTYIDAKSATATDQGEFTAIAACFNTVDRQGDRILPSAFRETIANHRASQKSVPLLWDHRGSDPEFVLGVVWPDRMEEVDEGLKVAGKLDLEGSAKARAAWRAIRSGAMSLSFGFLTLKSRTAPDGVNELQVLDLLEVSCVPSPAHPDTRFIDLKSASAEPESSADLRYILDLGRRQPAEVVREYEFRKGIEAKAAAEAERKAQGPLQVRTFEVQ